ncbi:hypothetical protein [Mesorhizobium sp.]|uniref:hypothetical protein n=1 Tax=Mesorhizobium sp. TaxID=1871066 RepID=UPI0025C732CD|nr:hypothetical protein [Mesorhizobium sp.]
MTGYDRAAIAAAAPAMVVALRAGRAGGNEQSGGEDEERGEVHGSAFKDIRSTAIWNPVACGEFRSLKRRLRRPSSGCRHLLPVNGEKDAAMDDFANSQPRRMSANLAASVFLPVYGEKCPAG